MSSVIVTGARLFIWEETGVEVQRYKGAKKENQEMTRKTIMCASNGTDSAQGYQLGTSALGHHNWGHQACCCGQEEQGGSSVGCFTWLTNKIRGGWTEHLGSIMLLPVPSLKALEATYCFITWVR